MRPDAAKMDFKPTQSRAWKFRGSPQLEYHTNLQLFSERITLLCSSSRPNGSQAAILGSICISTTQSVWNREHGQIGRGRSARQWLQNADVHVCFVWVITGWLRIRCDAWFESRISYCGIVGLDRKIWILWFHWKLMYWLCFSASQSTLLWNHNAIHSTLLSNYRHLRSCSLIWSCGSSFIFHAWRLVEGQMQLFEVSRKGRLKF